MNPPSSVSRPLRVVEDLEAEQATARKRLDEIGALTPFAEAVLARLPERFNSLQIAEAIEAEQRADNGPGTHQEEAENLAWLVRSRYSLVVPKGVRASEVVIFPNSENESRGIEDARLVRFTEDDGTTRYFGTYTAYNGFAILPTFMESQDFHTINIRPMHGQYARNKGVAIFPRRINGKYLASGRLDGENLYLLESDHPYVWNEAKLVQTPRFWWEMVIIGNCGSPLETDQGWLLLTHGVGPMRQYCIGATLLDREDPTKIIGQTEHPLIVPTGQERFGYVPNVVYSCGGMIHGDKLIIPYAISDMITTFASVRLDGLLDYLTRQSS
jgi:predicted GH43/DUF377 family glycosyl hydrolase